MSQYLANALQSIDIIIAVVVVVSSSSSSSSRRRRRRLFETGSIDYAALAVLELSM